MTLTWQNELAIFGTALLVLVGAKSCYDHGVARNAIRDEQYQAAVQEAKAYKRQVDSLVFQLDRRVAAFEALDSAYEHRAVRWRTKTIYDTTPGLPVFIREAPTATPPTIQDIQDIVRSADVTINACRETVETCQELQARKDAIIAAKDRVIATMPKPAPGWKRWGERAIIAAISFKLGRL